MQPAARAVMVPVPPGRDTLVSEGVALPGGVSSDIRVVETADGPIVVKRALEKLKVSADWRADPRRGRTEVRALGIARELLGAAHVPRVLWEAPDQHSFAMTLVSPSLRNWKMDLLAGLVDQRTARLAGTLLGMLHVRSAARAGLADMFEDRGAFIELRIVPFFTQVARRLGDVEKVINAVVAEMAVRRRVLVHGDYSPKNMLADGERMVLLDFEVAHWGDPAFDIAFCLAHLVLKQWRQTAPMEALREAGEGFLSAYLSAAGEAADDTHLGRMLGCLLLARTDGDSPVEYLCELNLPRVRDVARALLFDPPVRLTRSQLFARGS